MSSSCVMPRADFDVLLDALAGRGYSVVGPMLGEEAIVYGPISRTDDLPVGWTTDHDAGACRLLRRNDDALFGYAVGPESWKKYVYEPRVTLLEVTRIDGTLAFKPPEIEPKRYAFLGVRACELAALAIQDQVLNYPGYADRHYASVRDHSITVAVNCAVAGGTCFCVSMGTGPECRDGYDLLMTEIIDGDRHEFVVESGSEIGEEIIVDLPGREVEEADRERVANLLAETSAAMGREMPTDGLRELLAARPEHPRWEEVARRCLACANCTLVCPTCFCATVVDAVGFDGGPATRERHWDSCFALDFSNLHRVPVRASTKSRYRQWMTHKLSIWHDQFGMSGCVGCGRCITWCPVGIDITQEAAAMQAAAEVPV